MLRAMGLRARWLSVGLAGAFLLAAAPDARADEPAADSAVEARQQYQDGSKAFSAKRYSEAALHFEAAAAFKANAVALYTAALAWDLATRPERAADAYSRALEVPGLDAKQTNIAKDRVAALERTLGTLSVTAPDGYKVQLDSLTEVAAPARLHGNAGAHTLSIRAPGKPIERRDVSLEAGRATTLELKEPPKASPKPEPEPEPPPAKPAPPPETLPPRLRDQQFWTPLRVAGVGVAAVGVAALGTGVILGTSALGAKDAYNAAPTRPGFDHAESLQTLTNVVFVVGGVLTAGGIVMIVVPSGERVDRSVRVGFSPRGLSAGGTF
jgi:hypothetical protein